MDIIIPPVQNLTGTTLPHYEGQISTNQIKILFFFANDYPSHFWLHTAVIVSLSVEWEREGLDNSVEASSRG